MIAYIIDNPYYLNYIKVTGAWSVIYIKFANLKATPSRNFRNVH